MNKKIYIPGFWNKKDPISDKILSDNDLIVQKNIKEFPLDKIKEFISNKWWNIKEIVKDKYLIEENKINDFLENPEKFKWFIRSIRFTIDQTVKKIQENLDSNNWIDLICHSQWWLIAILSILKNPDILEYLKTIDLYAPLTSLYVWKSFHNWKEQSYYHWKNLIVRKSYLDDFEKIEKEMKLSWDLFLSFLAFLKDRSWKWKLNLYLWDKDPIIKLESFDLDEIQKFDFVEVKILNWDHYLWFKK